MQVTLSSDASRFKGFLIKVFDEDEKDVGSFRSTGPDSRTFSPCAGITHTWRDLKKRVVVQWLATEDKSGKVHFK
ncbi:secreted protein, putative [Ixodes scapularis]|uniref:Secreted protein, putative n=1 Tax=Ixodes scapularis TaxID=6945 RepID=B7P4X4_IXOSC|nr:secreted protein, putative [Ixodes scapularis]|eukprot:XP_002406553.1 secreted protein, putative [Ixodes scapularis]